MQIKPKLHRIAGLAPAKRSSYTVFIVELKFATDAQMHDRIADALAQHAELVEYLKGEGWTVETVPIVTGSMGTVLNLTHQRLTALLFADAADVSAGRDPASIDGATCERQAAAGKKARALAKGLHFIAIKYAHAHYRKRKQVAAEAQRDHGAGGLRLGGRARRAAAAGVGRERERRLGRPGRAGGGSAEVAGARERAFARRESLEFSFGSLDMRCCKTTRRTALRCGDRHTAVS